VAANGRAMCGVVMSESANGRTANIVAGCLGGTSRGLKGV
jgi:hypothetical protein